MKPSLLEDAEILKKEQWAYTFDKNTLKNNLGETYQWGKDKVLSHVLAA